MNSTASSFGFGLGGSEAAFREAPVIERPSGANDGFLHRFAVYRAIGDIATVGTLARQNATYLLAVEKFGQPAARIPARIPGLAVPCAGLSEFRRIDAARADLDATRL